MENNIVFDKVMVVLLIDIVVYLFINTYQLHKHKIKTTVLEDKLVMIMIGTVMIDIFYFIGRIYGIVTDAFIGASYLGFFGVFLIGLLIYMMIGQKTRDHLNGKL